MPKMTVAWLLLYWGGLLMTFVNPLYGLLTYLFEYYLRPVLHWWGKPLPDWRYNLMISLVLLLVFLARRHSLPAVRSVSNYALPPLLALGVNMLFVSTWAVSPGESWGATLAYWKLIALYGVIIGVVRTLHAFDAFIAMHIAGSAWWGWEAFINPQRSGGRLLNVGSADTLSDNLAAAHLLTVLPFVAVFLFTSISNRRYRWLAAIGAPLIINVFILCNSRGATVGLGVMFLAALILGRRGQRLKLAGIALAGVVAFLALADTQFIERQQTTTNYEAEGIERFMSWQGGIRLIEDHPLGVGGKGYHNLSFYYIPQVVDAHDGQRRAPHNTYVLISSEWGLQGLTLFLAFIGATFTMLHVVRRHASGHDALFYRSLAIQVGLIGTLAAGTFSDRFYGESIYWMCALSVALYRIHATVTVTAEQPAVSGFERARVATAGV